MSFPLFKIDWKPLMRCRCPPREDLYDLQRFTYTESHNKHRLCYCLEKNFKSFITSISWDLLLKFLNRCSSFISNQTSSLDNDEVSIVVALYIAHIQIDRFILERDPRPRQLGQMLTEKYVYSTRKLVLCKVIQQEIIEKFIDPRAVQINLPILAMYRRPREPIRIFNCCLDYGYSSGST